MRPRTEDPVVLAIHPADRGFGWAVFTGADAIMDWGCAEIHADKNARCRRRVEQLIERYEPEVVALEQFDGESSRRSPRVRALARSLVQLATRKRLDVRVFSRVQIGSTILGDSGASRQQIANAIAERVAAVRHKVPRIRKPWMSEQRDMALFSALAAALTYYGRESI